VFKTVPNRVLRWFLILLLMLLQSCSSPDHQNDGPSGQSFHPIASPVTPSSSPRNRPAGVKVIRVVVALCDNVHQGIVPVPARLGNGDDPESNLYWGAGYGVKTFLAKSPEWRVLAQIDRPRPGVLRRCILRHRTQDVYIIADAYQGIQIKRAISEFLDLASGAGSEHVAVQAGGGDLVLDGPADLIAYVGHDGVMDFSLPQYPRSRSDCNRDAMVLCCASKSYFSNAIRAGGARPLVLTTGLMAPEAYVLEAAITGWMSGETGEQICARAASAYNKYQKCGYRAARGLFTSGN